MKLLRSEPDFPAASEAEGGRIVSTGRSGHREEAEHLRLVVGAVELPLPLLECDRHALRADERRRRQVLLELPAFLLFDGEVVDRRLVVDDERVLARLQLRSEERRVGYE